MFKKDTIMKTQPTLIALAAAMAFGSPVALAFTSGSTGSDGAFSPTVNTQLTLPASGVFNFTTVNIPAGVTVTFKKNALNTPVVLLASGDVTVAGIVNASGTNGAATGAAGDGNIGDDSLPGVGGPGGYDGGRGGAGAITDVTNLLGSGGAGLGPGGGTGGLPCYYAPNNTTYFASGASGSFGAKGDSSASNYCPTTGYITSPSSPTYGSSSLVPLLGGSGGGGGSGGTTFGGAGGGGGGGAILIASSGTVTVSGQILADGGAAGELSGSAVGGTGGHGSGGAIKIVATAIAGDGKISAVSAPAVNGTQTGRIRLEAETITRTAATQPTLSFAAPGPLFVAGAPTLSISSVAGVAAPAIPTGNADIVLPSTTPNPVTVVFQTSGVPVGNTVKLTVTPAGGEVVSALSPALTGSTASASASVSITLPNGPSTLSATTTYTIVASLGDAMSRFARGERVEKVTLTAIPGKPQQVTLVTVSGREFDAPDAALTLLALK